LNEDSLALVNDDIFFSIFKIKNYLIIILCWAFIELDRRNLYSLVMTIIKTQ